MFSLLVGHIKLSGQQNILVVELVSSSKIMLFPLFLHEFTVRLANKHDVSVGSVKLHMFSQEDDRDDTETGIVGRQIV